MDFLKDPGTTTARQISLLRIQKCSAGRELGLPLVFFRLLQDAVSQWLSEGWHNGSSNTRSVLPTSTSTTAVRAALQVHLHCTKLDPILGEELGRQGSHTILLQLIKLDSSACHDEQVQNAILELQDLACEIAAACTKFPLTTAPLSMEELVGRLPLIFTIEPAQDIGEEYMPVTDKETGTVLIHQVTTRQSAQEDTGFVLWPSAVILARWLMTNPSSIRGKSVLELGAGCGLTGLTAARIIQQTRRDNDDSNGTMVLTDFNPTVLKNLVHNITLNEVNECCTVAGLDIYDQSTCARGWVDMDANLHDPVDVVLVTDMICQPNDAVAAANTLYASLKPGGRAYSVCPRGVHRFGVDQFVAECERVGLSVDVTNVQDLYKGALSSSSTTECANTDLDKTAGYWEGMNHDFFSIDKLPSEQSQ